LAERAPLESKHIIKLLDHFQHDGPNGRHHCLVFELCGPNLQWFHERWYGDKSNPKWALPMMKHILEGLAFIHEAGFVHAGIYAALETRIILTKLRSSIFQRRRCSVSSSVCHRKGTVQTPWPSLLGARGPQRWKASPSRHAAPIL
jgi:serine/threonine protein kinase